jgi:hypothetical protein
MPAAERARSRAGAAGRRAGLVAALWIGVAAAGCVVLPRQGTPVYVDHLTGRWWDGKGMLLEVSPDRQRCRIAARTQALVVEKKWVDCRHVHPREGY